MKRSLPLLLLAITAVLSVQPAHAHVGSKDVFEQIAAGPYKLFVTLRPPEVIPGVVVVEVRTSGSTVNAISITPIPLTGEAAKHPPTSDPMKRSSIDPAFFTGSLWLMAPGSWQVRLQLEGVDGPRQASVPVPAMPLSILPMQRSLGITLGLLGLFLVLSMAAIAAAAVREARLPPGDAPTPSRRQRAIVAAAASLAVMTLFVYAGDRWWNVEAAGYSLAIYHPLALRPTLSGNTLNLAISSYVDLQSPRRSRSNTDLLPDHGHPMHLYAIREPGMDAVFHLHPGLVAPGSLRLKLPAMPPGEYKLYADIVHATGFPETLTSNLTIPPNLPSAPLDVEDASAAPPALSAGELGPAYKLPDGYTMAWDRPANLTAGAAFAFRFHLLDREGRPATDMHPYLGMAGHAAFVKTDGSTFAHTHPEGSAAMPALMLANPGSMDDAAITSRQPEPLSNTVDFPYGFPTPGRYRIFIQMKHATTVETGVFDADVR